MTSAEFAILIAVSIGLLAHAAVIIWAIRRVLTRFQPTPPPPTREERIAWARGRIEACKGAELALENHTGDLPAACLLAQYRGSAACAKAELRALGVEP